MERSAYRDLETFEATHWWFRGRRAIIRSMLQRHLPQVVQHAVDVGCGTGTNALLLRPYAREVTGWDASAEAIRLVHVKHPDLMVEQVRFPEAAPRDRTFDIITLFDVLEHIEDDRAALRRLESLLAPGGTLFLTVPAFPFLWSGHDIKLHHFRRYTRASLVACIQSTTSLRLVSVNYFNFLFFPFISAIRFLRGKAQSSTGSDFFFGSGRVLTAVLAYIFALERFLVHKVRLPFGVSLLAVLKKEAA